MVRRVDNQAGPLGKMISDLVADTVLKVIQHATPHQQAERTAATHDMLADSGSKVHYTVRGIAQHCLDSGTVHPLLEPVFTLIAKGE
jgi:hypothetical protein